MLDVLVDSLFAQATVGVLSLNMPAEVYCSDLGAIHSSTNHWHSRPAISRSELVMKPVGFFSETRLAITYFGKMILQTVGLSGDVPLNHTPPAPNTHAST